MLYLITERVLSSGTSVIIESPFPPERIAKRVDELAEKYEFDCLQIRLFADPEIIFERFKTRAKSGERHSGHVDLTILDETEKAIFGGHGKIGKIPLDCPFLDVDTSDFTKIDYTKIIDFINKS